jgi:hypothetical protein
MAKRPQVPRKTLVRDAQAAISACAGWASRLAARRITNFLEERMHGSGLSLAQFGLMGQIAAAPDDTLGALAERTGLDQSTLSRNLRGLETAGFVEIATFHRVRSSSGRQGCPHWTLRRSQSIISPPGSFSSSWAV